MLQRKARETHQNMVKVKSKKGGDCCINGVAKCSAIGKTIETSPKAPTMEKVSLPMGVASTGDNVVADTRDAGGKDGLKDILLLDQSTDVRTLLDMVYESSFPEEQIFMKVPSQARLRSKKELIVRLLIGLDALGVPVMADMLVYVKKHGLEGIGETLVTLLDTLSPLLEGKQAPEYSTDDVMDAMDSEWHSASGMGSPLFNAIASAASSPRVSAASLSDSPYPSFAAGSPFRRVLSDRSMLHSRAHEMGAKTVLDKTASTKSSTQPTLTTSFSSQYPSSDQPSRSDELMLSIPPISLPPVEEKHSCPSSRDGSPRQGLQRKHRRKSSSLRQLFAEELTEALSEGSVGTSSKRNSRNSSKRRNSAEFAKLALNVSESSSPFLSRRVSTEGKGKDGLLNMEDESSSPFLSRRASTEGQGKNILSNVEDEHMEDSGSASRSSQFLPLADKGPLFWREGAEGFDADLSNDHDNVQNPVPSTTTLMTSTSDADRAMEHTGDAGMENSLVTSTSDADRAMEHTSDTGMENSLVTFTSDADRITELAGDAGMGNNLVTSTSGDAGMEKSLVTSTGDADRITELAGDAGMKNSLVTSTSTADRAMEHSGDAGTEKSLVTSTIDADRITEHAGDAGMKNSLVTSTGDADRVMEHTGDAGMENILVTSTSDADRAMEHIGDAGTENSLATSTSDADRATEHIGDAGMENSLVTSTSDADRAMEHIGDAGTENSLVTSTSDADRATEHIGDAGMENSLVTSTSDADRTTEHAVHEGMGDSLMTSISDADRTLEHPVDDGMEKISLLDTPNMTNEDLPSVHGSSATPENGKESMRLASNEVEGDGEEQNMPREIDSSLKYTDNLKSRSDFREKLSPKADGNGESDACEAVDDNEFNTVNNLNTNNFDSEPTHTTSLSQKQDMNNYAAADSKAPNIDGKTSSLQEKCENLNVYSNVPTIAESTLPMEEKRESFAARSNVPTLEESINALPENTNNTNDKAPPLTLLQNSENSNVCSNFAPTIDQSPRLNSENSDRIAHTVDEGSQPPQGSIMQVPATYDTVDSLVDENPLWEKNDGVPVHGAATSTTDESTLLFEDSRDDGSATNDERGLPLLETSACSNIDRTSAPQSSLPLQNDTQNSPADSQAASTIAEFQKQAMEVPSDDPSVTKHKNVLPRGSLHQRSHSDSMSSRRSFNADANMNEEELNGSQTDWSSANLRRKFAERLGLVTDSMKSLKMQLQGRGPGSPDRAVEVVLHETMPWMQSNDSGSKKGEESEGELLEKVSSSASDSESSSSTSSSSTITEVDDAGPREQEIETEREATDQKMKTQSTDSESPYNHEEDEENARGQLADQHSQDQAEAEAQQDDSWISGGLGLIKDLLAPLLLPSSSNEPDVNESRNGHSHEEGLNEGHSRDGAALSDPGKNEPLSGSKEEYGDSDLTDAKGHSRVGAALSDPGKDEPLSGSKEEYGDSDLTDAKGADVADPREANDEDHSHQTLQIPSEAGIAKLVVDNSGSSVGTGTVQDTASSQREGGIVNIHFVQHTDSCPTDVLHAEADSSSACHGKDISEAKSSGPFDQNDNLDLYLSPKVLSNLDGSQMNNHLANEKLGSFNVQQTPYYEALPVVSSLQKEDVSGLDDGKEGQSYMLPAVEMREQDGESDHEIHRLGADHSFTESMLPIVPAVVKEKDEIQSLQPRKEMEHSVSFDSHKLYQHPSAGGGPELEQKLKYSDSQFDQLLSEVDTTEEATAFYPSGLVSDKSDTEGHLTNDEMERGVLEDEVAISPDTYKSQSDMGGLSLEDSLRSDVGALRLKHDITMSGIQDLSSDKETVQSSTEDTRQDQKSDVRDLYLGAESPRADGGDPKMDKKGVESVSGDLRLGNKTDAELERDNVSREGQFIVGGPGPITALDECKLQEDSQSETSSTDESLRGSRVVYESNADANFGMHRHSPENQVLSSEMVDRTPSDKSQKVNYPLVVEGVLQEEKLCKPYWEASEAVDVSSTHPLQDDNSNVQKSSVVQPLAEKVTERMVDGFPMDVNRAWKPAALEDDVAGTLDDRDPFHDYTPQVAAVKDVEGSAPVLDQPAPTPHDPYLDRWEIDANGGQPKGKRTYARKLASGCLSCCRQPHVNS
ncbi:hypothetical protein L7F22_053059 [Adiantum nelumboides]|nr:hypothetical protein [Adiantum nelumboides]